MFSTIHSAKAYFSSSPAAPARVAGRAVHFGGDNEPVQQRPKPDDDIKSLVVWYHRHIRRMKPLKQEDRSNHSEHLIAIGRLVGLLQPAKSAMDAALQYRSVFNTLENFVAARPPQSKRMAYCDPRSEVEVNGYHIKAHIFHVLVYGPNGAIERFRRITPLEIDVRNGQTDEIKAKRKAIAASVTADVNALKETVEFRRNKETGIPEPFGDPELYVREVFAPGRDGNDAWGQPFVPSKEQLWLRDMAEQVFDFSPARTQATSDGEPVKLEPALE